MRLATSCLRPASCSYRGPLPGGEHEPSWKICTAAACQGEHQGRAAGLRVQASENLAVAVDMQD